MAKGKKRRKIHVLTKNSSGVFQHTFGSPDNVLDLIRGWLQFPDRPYTITINEESDAKAKRG